MRTRTSPARRRLRAGTATAPTNTNVPAPKIPSGPPRWLGVVAALLVAFAATSSAQANGLTWIKDDVAAQAGPETALVQVEFPFINQTARTITITEVKPGCGCTTALLDHRRYAPGEAGVVHAIFSVGDRTGVQDKVIAVRTDSPGEEEPKELAFHITISAYLAFAPHAVFWQVGEPPVEKTILCTAGRANAVTLMEARPDAPDIVTRIETVEPGRTYRLHLRPASTGRPLSTPIRLRFSIAGATPRTFEAFAYVTPPREVHR